jgi:uncharacterized membrane protein
MAENPYAAPRTHVEDIPDDLPDGQFIPDGRGVPAGNGWRWIADAWRFMGPQRWVFIGVVLLFWVLILAASFVPLLGGIAVTLFSPVFSGGIMLGCEAVRRGEQLEVGHLFAGFQRHFGKLVALGAISFGLGMVIAIVVLVIVGVSLGGALFSGTEPTPEQILALGLPMVLAVLVALAISIPIYMFLWFAAPLIVLADREIGAALGMSFQACLKNIVPFLVWSVIVVLLAIPATIPIFLGWLLLGPVLTVSIYTGYRDVFYEA